MNNTEITSIDDFEKAFNFRRAEKCCGNCKYGKCEIEVKEKTEQFTYPDENGNLKKMDYTTERMFARPPFGCIKNMDKNVCELNKSKGCDVCEFNCIKELEPSGKLVNAYPNFHGWDELRCEHIN